MIGDENHFDERFCSISKLNNARAEQRTNGRQSGTQKYNKASEALC